MFDILAIGELNNDYIFTGLGSMPQVGKEIITQGFSLVLGSSTAITASQLAKLELSVAFCSLVGDDANGHMAIEFIKKNGVDTRYIKTDASVTTGITVSMTHDRDRALMTYLGAIEQFSLKHFSLDILQNTRHVHVGSFFLQSALRKDLPVIFKAAKEAGCSTSLDAGWDDTGCWDYGINEVLKYTDIFFPNEGEAAAVTKEADPEAAVKKLGSRIAVVKCGGAGAVAYHEGKLYKKASFTVTPVDTTGAGDCFNAGFIYGFLQGLGIDECLELGNACGAVCVTRVGGASACASRTDVEKMRA